MPTECPNNKHFLCSLDSEDEYFDSEDYPQQPEKVVSSPKKQLKKETKTVQEELTDLQLKFEIKEASVGFFFCIT